MVREANNGSTGAIDLEIFRISQRHKTIRLGLRLGGVAVCIFLFGRALEPFAGEVTLLTVVLNVLGDLKFSLTITLAGIAIAWAVLERMLRYRKTQYLQERIRKLELRFDAGRSSSGLHPTGRTHPMDRGT